MNQLSFLPYTDPNWPGLIFQVARETDVDEISEFLIAKFFTQTPLYELMKMEPDRELRPWYPRLITLIVQDGHSIIVRDSCNGNRLAAVHLNCVNEPDIKQFANPDGMPKLWTVIDFIDHLNNDVNLYQMFNVDRIFHIYVISVHEQYSRRGIAGKLVNLSIELAKRREIRVLAVEAVSMYASKILTRAGFQRVKEISFNDYIYNGTKPFANDGVHQKGQLLVLKV